MADAVHALFASWGALVVIWAVNVAIWVGMWWLNRRERRRWQQQEAERQRQWAL